MLVRPISLRDVEHPRPQPEHPLRTLVVFLSSRGSAVKVQTPHSVAQSCGEIMRQWVPDHRLLTGPQFLACRVRHPDWLLTQTTDHSVTSLYNRSTFNTLSGVSLTLWAPLTSVVLHFLGPLSDPPLNRTTNILMTCDPHYSCRYGAGDRVMVMESSLSSSVAPAAAASTFT